MTREIIQNAAEAEGFSILGISPAVSPSGYSHLLKWIEDGFAGEMQYFKNRQEAYQHPNSVLEGVRSIVMLAYPYPASAVLVSKNKRNEADLLDGIKTENEQPFGNSPKANSENHVKQDSALPQPSATGLIARYASTGTDYHDELHPKLKRLCKAIQAFAPDSSNRGVVDTAPLMEREFAQLAGLGWIGKNTLLINKRKGSYFFLACILTSLSLEPSTPHSASHCGTCTACLDACPTDAFPEPGRLDARKCISYLTIEHRGSIPYELRSKMGDWVFGCDVCQEVCPWNKKPSVRWTAERKVSEVKNDPIQAIAVPEKDVHSTERTPLSTSHTGSNSRAKAFERTIELLELFSMDDDAFRQAFRKTPLWRPRRRGLLRNAAVVLGNQKDPKAIPALKLGLQDPDPIVRGACVWALGNLKHPVAKQALQEQLKKESDSSVLQEIRWSLQPSDKRRSNHDQRSSS